MADTFSSLMASMKQPRVTCELARATFEHQAVERHFRERMQGICLTAPDLEFPYLRLNPLTYFQRNFFSILFLSLYRTVGILRDRRRAYGVITHAIRGVVTCTDNILDDEDKGAVRLAGLGGRVLPNVLLILFQNALLSQVIEELAPDREQWLRAHRTLMTELYNIAREESDDERAVQAALPPQDILGTIHKYRGACLLELAFVVPASLEPDLTQPLAAARRAVGDIGLGLQILDDVTDLAEDLERGNHNFLRSWIVHRGPDGPITDAELTSLSEKDQASPERRFPRATTEVLRTAMDRVLNGFDLIHELGHVIDRDSALELAGLMFRLRGLGHLWKLYSAPSGGPDGGA